MIDLHKYASRFKERFAELESVLSSSDLYSDPKKAQEITREHSRLKTALSEYERLLSLEKQAKENTELLETEEDEEMLAMLRDELPKIEEESETIRGKLVTMILPPEPNDDRNIIVEIRAGTGGDEAAIFAGDLFRMYSRYAERAGWKIDVIDTSLANVAGYKEITFGMSGDEVFRQMRFESGVHRVQRVPATEAQGRIHTSTATVAVLPEAEEVDIVIKPDEIRVEVCRAGGPGGQGVNTTDSAVQILHIPTGIIVRCQDGRSQIKNRDKAMSILRSRLLEAKQKEEDEKYSAHRKSQIGSGDRNEKIRTYNYPQNRITDHRINFTSYNLPLFMDGDIGEMLDQLQARHVADRIAEMEAARI